MKHYQEIVDEVFNRSMYKHRTLRTLFDKNSSEWLHTTINEKLSILFQILDSGKISLEDLISDYKYFYLNELANKDHVLIYFDETLEILKKEAKKQGRDLDKKTNKTDKLKPINEDIVAYIIKNQKNIIDNIDQESIDVYKFLEHQFNETDVSKNYLFQFLYRSFYRLDNAGLTPEFKTEYFKILEALKKENFSIEDILKRLKSFKNLKGQESVQFSFVTKMINIVDKTTPIYDSKVATVFKMSYPESNEFEEKVSKYIGHLDTIKAFYERIIINNLLADTLNEFDVKYEENGLNTIKKLDFIFWSAGKLIEESLKKSK